MEGLTQPRVSPERDTKSISNETTFNTDIGDHGQLRAILRRLSEQVSERLKAADMAGRTVTLKLKTAEFKTLTRARSLPAPTQLADRIFRAGDDLLRGETNGRRFRLIGIGVSEFADPVHADPDDLVDDGAGRAARRSRWDTMAEASAREGALGFGAAVDRDLDEDEYTTAEDDPDDALLGQPSEADDAFFDSLFSSLGGNDEKPI